MYRLDNRFPAEWEPQSGVMLTWPHVGTDWCDMLEEVERCYVAMAVAIARYEPLLIVTPDVEGVRERLRGVMDVEGVRFCSCPTDDTWARDHGFLTVLKGRGARLLDFCFNGWGGKFGAEQDNDINRRLYGEGCLSGEYVDCLDFVLEGGSVESDGQGTLLATAQCLTAAGRNDMSEDEVAAYLCERLCCDRVLWLRSGLLEGDDTDGHVDTLARFCEHDTIAYVNCRDEEDVHYVGLQAMEEELRSFRTSGGAPYRLLPLPLPDAIYEGSERLPATYANFLVINGAVLMPTYGQPLKDGLAMEAMRIAFPHRDVIGVDCRALIRQHGSLHCSTMQFPEGVLRVKG